MKIKTQLIFPPAWEITQPYLSIPSLYAYLKNKGKEVSQIDLNIILFDEILSSDYMRKTEESIKEKLYGYDGNEKDVAESTLSFMPMIIDKIDEAKKKLRSKEELSIYDYGRYRNLFARALASISIANHPEEISFIGYEGIYESGDVQGIIQNIMNREKSFLYEIYEKYIIEIVGENKLIGISVSGENQVVPAFILASMIKSYDNEVKVFMGGNVVTRWKDQLYESIELFDYVDYMLLYEGEVGIEKLIEVMEGNGDINSVPNIFYKDIAGGIHFNEGDSRVDINELPTPEFDERNMDKYFWHQPVLPLLTSRGCYWGRCAFCDHSYVYNGRYQRRNPELIASDIIKINEKYGVSNINFHDEAIKPDGLEDVLKAIEIADVPVRWSCDARFDRNLTKELLEKLFARGLRVVFFGLESACQRVLNFMKKGTELNTIKRILKDSSECGIWNHAFFFLGFPTETEAESRETLAFLYENEKNIRSYGGSRFSLGKFSTVAMNAEKYKIEELGIESELSLRRDFKYKEGTQKNVVKELLKENHKLAKERQTHPSELTCRDHWVEFSDRHHWEMNNDDEIKLKANVILYEKDERISLMDLETLRSMTLHKSSKEVLDMMVDGTSNEKICNLLRKKYGLERAKAEESIKPMINKIRDLSMILGG